jgi:hypothetical protein
VIWVTLFQSLIVSGLTLVIVCQPVTRGIFPLTGIGEKPTLFRRRRRCVDGSGIGSSA